MNIAFNCVPHVLGICSFPRLIFWNLPKHNYFVCSLFLWEKQHICPVRCALTTWITRVRQNRFDLYIAYDSVACEKLSKHQKHRFTLNNLLNNFCLSVPIHNVYLLCVGALKRICKPFSLQLCKSVNYLQDVFWPFYLLPLQLVWKTAPREMISNTCQKLELCVKCRKWHKHPVLMRLLKPHSRKEYKLEKVAFLLLRNGTVTC